jgi:hypothetical protein
MTYWRKLVVEHPAFAVELTGDYNALEIEQLLKCGHVCSFRVSFR